MVMGVQQQLLTMFAVQKPFNKSNPKWKKLTDSICYFLAKDVRLFDTVNDSGFRHLLNAFEHRYRFATRYMQDLY